MIWLVRIIQTFQRTSLVRYGGHQLVLAGVPAPWNLPSLSIHEPPPVAGTQSRLQDVYILAAFHGMNIVHSLFVLSASGPRSHALCFDLYTSTRFAQRK